MKSFEDAYQCGECEDCERDCVICHEEGVCLAEAALKTIAHVQLTGSYVEFEFNTEEECLRALLTPRRDCGKYIKVQNIYINPDRINYIGLEKKYVEKDYI